MEGVQKGTVGMCCCGGGLKAREVDLCLAVETVGALVMVDED